MKTKRGLGLLACAGLVVSLVAGAAVFAASASAAACPAYEFIAARGAGEDPSVDYSAADLGMGATADKVYRTLAGKLPAGSISAYGVHYPAVNPVPNTLSISGLLSIGNVLAYPGSVRTGRDDIANQIKSEHAACGATKFVLAGYSEGAQSVVDALQDAVPAADRPLVAAVVLFGDPYFNPDDTAVDQGTFNPNYTGILGSRIKFATSAYAGPIRSYCNAYDFACDFTKKVASGTSILTRLGNAVNSVVRIAGHASDTGQSFNQPHDGYLISGSASDDTTNAANWLATTLGY